MEFRFIQIPAEDYEALGITEDSVIQTYITDDGALVVRAVSPDDLENFKCDGDCEPPTPTTQPRPTSGLFALYRTYLVTYSFSAPVPSQVPRPRAATRRTARATRRGASLRLLEVTLGQP